MDTYLEYLKDAYNRIVQLSVKDESLNVLSQMENKNFYLSRVHELFVELYSAERENKIKMLLEEVQTLKIKAVSQKQIYSPVKSSPTQSICQKCLMNSRINQPSSQLFPQIESTTKQNLHRTIKQNQMLSEQLKQTNQSHIEEIKVLSTINQQTQTKLTMKIQNLTNNLEEIEKRYKELRNKNQSQVKAVEDLRRDLVEERQLNIRANGKIRELEKDAKSSEQQCTRLREQIASLKQAKDMLEDKINRLQEMKTHQKNKLEIYQKQFKNISRQQQSNPNKYESLNLSEQDHKQQDLNSLITTLTAKQLEIKRLTTDRFTITQQNTTLRRQLTDYKTVTQKSMSELKENFNRIKLDYEKQLRIYRENEKNNLIAVKKLEMDSKIIKIEDYKEKIKAIEIQKYKVQNKLVKIQHSNQILLQNYEQITQAFRQQKQIFDKKLEQYEQSIQNYHKLQKQLSKRNQIKQSQCKELQKELREKISYYDEKIVYLEEQLDQCKKNEEKLLRQNQKYENQIKNSMLNDNNQKFVLRQHELKMRINELENLVEETRNTSKQLLDRKQQKSKDIKRELEEKHQRIIEYEIKLEKEISEKENYRKSLKQTELILRKQQQKIVQIQQKNRAQILEMMRNFDTKTKQLTDQLTKHYSSTSNYKINLNQKSTFVQNIKQLEQQYRLKVRSMQAESSAIKSKNILLEDKLKQSEHKLRNHQQELLKSEQKLHGLKERQNTLQNMYQQQKNKGLQIIKYYEDKINNYRNIFREFKYEICQQFLSVTTSFKNQLAQIKKDQLKNFQTFYKNINTKKIQLEQKIISYQSTANRKCQQENSKLYEQKMIKYERQKEELKNHYQNKLKQKSMDLMTISAEKQFVLEQIKQSQSILNKKYKQLEGMYTKLVGKLEKNEKNQNELKEIIMKMEGKVNDAQRNYMIKQKQVNQLQRIIDELNQKLEKTDKLYKTQIKQCREKYREQNEKIFNKYERQFNKIITLNSKKNKDRPSLTSIMSARGISIPTKGNIQQDKIQKLKRQIQEQKKLVQEMESMKKF